MEELISKINELIKKQEVCESLDCYDDMGQYFNAGYYAGYVEAMEDILKIIEKGL
jgi:hypothetical protein